MVDWGRISLLFSRYGGPVSYAAQYGYGGGGISSGYGGGYGQYWKNFVFKAHISSFYIKYATNCWLYDFMNPKI